MRARHSSAVHRLLYPWRSVPRRCASHAPERNARRRELELRGSSAQPALERDVEIHYHANRCRRVRLDPVAAPGGALVGLRAAERVALPCAETRRPAAAREAAARWNSWRLRVLRQDGVRRGLLVLGDSLACAERYRFQFRDARHRRGAGKPVHGLVAADRAARRRPRPRVCHKRRSRPPLRRRQWPKIDHCLARRAENRPPQLDGEFSATRCCTGRATVVLPCVRREGRGSLASNRRASARTLRRAACISCR